MFSNIGSPPFSRQGIKRGIRRRTESDWGALAVELKKPGVTLSILWEKYRAVHPDGYAYSRFCDLFRGFERRLTPTMRQVHVAGDIGSDPLYGNNLIDEGRCEILIIRKVTSLLLITSMDIQRCP
ncbi:transposase [Mesorhizobium sp. M4A.F.Ca.ET.022.05.2.1]|uniref:transposase n=1 Tax=Mesorhizobium sp. M4A.F.Ca.ET.022.05.2.1 TaxID=2496653 RepID=UPI0016782301|nr:transposase [Mesorhizobium sp. M4A.F.Ca.ET.022.05.2.1]